MNLRLPVVVSLTAHALIALVLLAALGHVTPMPLHVVAPLPPATPDPPPQVTDSRVFPNALTLYSSLPLIPAEGNALSLYVANGVGINFLSLPDIGATYRQGNVEWRVWPGQALEGLIVRRELPEYPRGTNTRGSVSVFVEYLVTLDGSVKVLRTAGPARFTSAAQSAIEHWVYRPLEYENRPCEVVSRVEVRFDSDFPRSAPPNERGWWRRRRSSCRAAIRGRAAQAGNPRARLRASKIDRSRGCVLRDHSVRGALFERYQ